MKNNPHTKNETIERRILIIDDNKDFVLSLVDILESRGFVVETAYSAIDALNKIQDFDAHIALIDIRLGHSSGISLISRFKSANPKILCVMMTGYADIDTSIQALKEGAYDYLRKPMETQDTLATIDRCFEKVHLESEKSAADKALKNRNRELEEMNARLELMVKSVEIVTSCHSRNELNKLLLEEVARNMAAEGGSLFLCHEEGLELAHSLDSDHVPSFKPFSLPEDSILGRVLRERRPIFIKNIKEEGGIKGSGWEGYKDGSLLVFPLMGEEKEIIGLISLHNKRWPPFTKQDLELGLIFVSLSNEVLRTLHVTEVLRESRHLLNSVIDNSPAIIYVKDDNGRFLLLNKRCEELFGVVSENIVGKKDEIFFPKDMAEKFRDNDQRVLQANLPQEFEEAVLHRNGELHTYISIKFPLQRKDGTPYAVCGISTDITDRKQADEMLKESEKKYRTLFERSADAVLIIEGDNFVDCNSATVKMLGYKNKKELLNTHPSQLSPPLQPDGQGSFEKANQMMAMALDQGSNRFEWDHQRKNGEVFPVEVLLTSIPFKEGNFLHVVWRDITERKQDENALHESEGKYRSLFEAAGDAIFIVKITEESKTIIVDCNEYTLGIFGCSREEIIGKSLENFSPSVQPDGRPSHEVIIEIAKATLGTLGVNPSFEFTHCKLDGTLFDTEVKLNRIDINKETHIQAIIRDVTGRKRAEREMSRLRNLLKSIIDSMPSILIGVDREGRITQWNQEAEKNTGVSSEDANGQVFTKVFPQLTGKMEKLKQTIKDRVPIKEEKVPQKSNGEIRYTDVTIYPLVTNDADAEGAVIRIDDITERVRFEDMMVQTEKMMSVGELATGIAHEINNPLSGILLNIQVVKERLTSNMQANEDVAQKCGTNLEAINAYMDQRNIVKMLKDAQTSGQRAAKIVANMLRFGRKSSSNFAPHNIIELLEETIDMAKNDFDLNKKYDFRRIKIERMYAEDIPILYCERSEVQQVFLNLLKNGAEAMTNFKDGSKGPVFILHVFRNGKVVQIEVEDNGPGMDESIRKRIFEPFFTTKGVGVGTGLGLSVSYFIITKNHGGTMSVESSPGQGTKFIICLPCKGEKL